MFNLPHSVRRSIGKRRLTYHILSVIAVAGMFSLPALTTHAQNDIAKADNANAGTISKNGQVTDILADQVVNNIAINRFKSFQLDQGNIANLYFGTTKSGASASTLMNFVDSKVDVNGTLNAIRNGRVDGNLYFLSPSGIAIGANGVINAGKVGLIVPQESTYDTLLSNAFKGKVSLSPQQLRSGEIPLNEDGSLTVQGKINTVDGVLLAASNIHIESGAKILSRNTLDYSSLVNIKENGTITADAGLGSNLALSRNEAGDIVLLATVQPRETLTWNKERRLKSSLGFDYDQFRYPSTAGINVANGASITSGGNVELTSQATLQFNFDQAANLDDAAWRNLDLTHYFLPVSGMQANVSLDGKVSGKQVSVNALTNYTYKDWWSLKGGSDDDWLSRRVTAVDGALHRAGLAATYIMENTSANIDVGQNAIIEAQGTGDALALSSGSHVTAELLTQSAISHTASIAYEKNKASLTVDGSLTAAKGNILLGADATSNVKLVSRVKDANTNGKSWLAANVLIGNNDSFMEFGDTARLLANNGNISIKSNSTNQVDAKAELDLKGGLGGFTANFAWAGSSARVKGAVEAGAKDIRIQAGNTTTGYRLLATNTTKAAGKQKDEGGVDETLKDVNNLKNTFLASKGGMVEKLKFGSFSSETLDSLAKYITTDVSVGVGKSIAQIDLSRETKLTAADTLALSAKTASIGTEVGAISTKSGLGGGGVKSALFRPTIAVVNRDSDAGIVIEGSDESDFHAALTGSKVSLSSSIDTSNGRFDIARAELLKEKSALLSLLDGKGLAKSRAESFLKGLEALDGSNAVGSPTELLPVFQGSAEVAALLQSAYGKNNKQANSLIEKLNALSSASKIANYYADSSSYVDLSGAASSAAKGESTTSIAAAVNVGLRSDRSRILIGQDTAIKATGGNIDIGSNLNQSDITLSGHMSHVDPKRSAVDAVVNISKVDADNVVAVAEGASLTGRNIAIKGTNDVSHIYLNDSSGLQVNAGLNVMGNASYVGGGSKALVSVDDEAKLSATDIAADRGNISIFAKNEADLLNIAGGLSFGSGTTAMGASVAVSNYDVKTLAAISDNDSGSDSLQTPLLRERAGYADKPEDITFDESDGASIKIMQQLAGSGNQEEAPVIFGTADRQDSGSIQGHSLNIQADTDGLINTLAVAGVVGRQSGQSKDKDKDNPQQPQDKSSDNAPEKEKDGASNALLQVLKKNAGSKVGNLIDQYQDSFTLDKNSVLGQTVDKLSEAQKKAMEAKQKLDAVKESSIGKLMEGGAPQSTFTGAGSAALNITNNETTAVLEKANIILRKNSGELPSLSLKSLDNAFTGAWSGAAAISFRGFDMKGSSSSSSSNSSNSSGSGKGMAGAIAMNWLDGAVLSRIEDSNISLSGGTLTNLAQKKGALVAAGLSLTAQASGNSGGKNYAGADSVSVNLGANVVGAELINSSAIGLDSIRNQAYDEDTQVTGGVNVSVAAGGNGSTAAGGTAAFANLANDVHAAIEGGNYAAGSMLSNTARTSVTQIGGAVGVSVAASQGNSYGFQGVMAYNRLRNKDTASLLNANVKTKTLENIASDQAAGQKTYDRAIGSTGLDVTGESYLAEVRKNPNGEVNNSLSGSYGNKIITAAFGLAASNKGSGSSAAAISDIANDFQATIKGGNLNSPAESALTLSSKADSNTLDVNAAAGIAATAAAKGFGTAGSLALQLTNNKVFTSLEGMDKDHLLQAKNLRGADLQANSAAKEINVAGQVSVGGNAAAGLAMAYNQLDNTTNANIKNARLEMKQGNALPDSISLTAANTGKVYAVGAGVSVALGKAALNGTAAMNRGASSVNASLENIKATNLKTVNISTKDKTDKLSVAGSLQGSTQVAIGGALAYNDIGTSARRQQNAASILNAKLAFQPSNPANSLNVTAEDTSKLTTIGAGVGLTTGAAAVEGAAAMTTLNKDIATSIKGSEVTNAPQAGIKAKSTEDITTTAAVLAVSRHAAIGAGLAVNNSGTHTTALLSDAKIAASSLEVEAASNSTIHNVAAGGGVALQGAAVTGSVSLNNINNKTTAAIDNSSIAAQRGSVALSALSDENITNTVGVVSGAAQGAAVGAAVAKNVINSDTSAAISGDKTTVEMANGSEVKIKDGLAGTDGAIAGTLASASKNSSNKSSAADGEKILGSYANLADKRSENTYMGIVASASGTHTIKSLLANAGIAGQGAAINGTFNVNEIGGSTQAKVDKARLSTSGNGSNVSIIAHDYTNAYGMVGTVSAAGQGAGAGIGSDTATVNRKTRAQASGQNRQNNDITADMLNIEASSWQGLASHVAGIGFAGMGAGIMFGTGVYTLASQTETAMDNVRANLRGSLYQQADHHGKLYSDAYSLGVAGVGAGVGAGVAVVKEQSKVDTLVNNAKVSFTNKGNSTIRALNDTRLSYELYNIGVGGIGGLAGSIGVANVTDDVTARVLNSEIGWNGVAVDGLSIAAENNIHFNNTAFTGAAGLAAGMGVGVVLNTIDSRVQTDIANSKLSAKDISLTAKENRDIAQSAYNASLGAVGASANVMLTNVGQKLADSYESATNKGKAADGSKVDVKGLLNSANNNTKKTQLKAEASQGLAGTTTAAVADNGGRERAGVSLNMSNSAMQATTGNIKLTSQATNNVTQGNKAVSFGGAVINGAVGILNNAGRTTLNLTNTYGKAAKNIEINTLLEGQNKLNILQGSAALTGAGSVAYAGLANNSASSVNISGERLTADSGNIIIDSKDAVKSTVNAIGVTVAGKAIGALVAETSGTGNNSVVVGSGLEINAKNAEISIQAQSAPETKLTAIAAVGSASFAGVGLSAQSEYTGKTMVDIAPNTSLKGSRLNIKAQNAPQITTQVGTGSLSMLAALSATGVKNAMGNQNNPHVTRVSIGENSSLLAQQMNIESNWKPYQNLDLISLSAGSASVGVTHGILTAYGTNDVQVGKSAYAKDAELTVSANSALNQDGVVRGLAAGGLASGSNFLSAVRNVRNAVDLGGMSNPQEKIRGVVTGSYNGLSQNFRAVGYGAGFATISPFTAVINDTEKRETNLLLGGDWNLSGYMLANVQNANNANVLSVDGKSAAMVGLSGVSMTRKADNTAMVQLKSGTRVTSDQEQSYNANNDLSVNETVDAAGYGGINGSGSELKNTGIYRANVEIGEANGKGAVSLTTNGEEAGISMGAATSGNVNAKNQLQAGGAASLIRASSQHDVHYDNNIILRNANLLNKGSSSDINLGAADNTALNLVTVGNIQGGLGGKATALTDNKLQRSAKVTLADNSSLFSQGEINMAAGADTIGRTGNLDLYVMADVYNRTAIPVSTKPRITNTMKQANQVDIGKGSKVTAARDISLTANTGKEALLESAYVYTTYSSKANNQLVAVLPNEKNNAEQQDNFVNIAGEVKAGIYNSLALEINSNQTVNVKEGGDWFKADGIKFGQQQTVNNPYLKEYNELVNARKTVTDSTLAKTYDTAINNLLQTMAAKGYAQKNGSSYKVLETVTVTATVLPNITVAGANVDVYSPRLTVGGSLKAFGATSISITDKGNSRLVVNDLELASMGGQVRLNGKNYKAANIQSSTDTTAPVLTIKKMGGNGKEGALLLQGNLINNAGKVSIRNDVGDILNTGTISSAYATEIHAPNGNYSQKVSGESQVVGLHPLTPYTFGSEMFTRELYLYLIEPIANKSAYRVLNENALFEQRDISNYGQYLVGVVHNVFQRMKQTEAGRTEIAKILGIPYAQFEKNSKEQNANILKEKYASLTKEGAIVAGGDVSIAAGHIFVNGLIQSGYSTYSTAVDAAKVAALDKQVRRGVTLTDSDVLGNANYSVDSASVKGGNIWNANQKAFEGLISTYYNPYTGHLLTADTVVRGGNVYLTGKVYSTVQGAGRILSAKGAADLIIDAENLNKDLYLGSIANNYRNGNIFINGKLQTGKFYQPTNDLLLWNMNADANIKQSYNYKVEANFHDKQVKQGKESALSYFELLGKGSHKKVPEYSMKASIDLNQIKKIGSATFLADDRQQYMIGKMNISAGPRDNLTISPSDPQPTKEIHRGFWNDDFQVYSYNRTNKTTFESQTGIKADYLIDTQQLESKNGGSITIKAGGNVIFANDIAGAVKDGKGIGEIRIRSLNGAITAEAGKIITTNKLTFNSDKDVDVTVNSANGSPIVTGASKNGNVSITARGSLLVDNVSSVKPDGRVNLTAEDDIKGTNNGYQGVLMAMEINLTSHQGTIGSNKKYLDLEWKGNQPRVNADARGNIYLAALNGDLKVGHIVSSGGDVALKAEKGSIVDGIGTSGALSDSRDKVNTWQALGLISAQDQDSSSAVAGAAEKAERLAGVTGRLETLGYTHGKDKAYYINIARIFAKDNEVLKRKAAFEAKAQNITDEAAYEQLFQGYRQEQQAWFASAYAGLSEAERAAVMEYGLLEASNDYGFSKNQLLYAIQDSIVNSTPGQIAIISKPNISARNISLDAGQSVGFKDKAVTIQAKDIGNKENLQILSLAKAGDLTWDANGNVTVARHVPLTLDIKKGGKLTVKDSLSTSLAGTENTTFDFTTGFGHKDYDASLMTGNGIYLPNDGNSVISGDKVTLYAGRGNIGSLDNYLRTNIRGYLDANTSGSIFIGNGNEGDLTIVSAVAGADRRPVLVGTNQVQPIAEGETTGLFLKTMGNMKMSQDRGRDMGYLMGSSVNLSAANLGTRNDPLRIYANGAALKLDCDDAWLRAVGTGVPLQINRYNVNTLSLANPERFMWMLDRSDALYKDLYGFYGDDYDWLESPFALKEPHRLTASDENEAMEIKDVMLENEGVTRKTNQTNVGAERPRELAIVKDVEGGIKISENQQQ
ncbi:leukotoxin LktA family filamentous adhesin [Selenomonas ruminantium]|uniref:leukotoxin LktA family filamentous adhesin n=1 Tax=Selenomonas ruminantium TaxID=971 RepID=UPI0004231630|nr:leukotoxin LktA family filamentous adhesin [Selenomonas ruminantium]